MALRATRAVPDPGDLEQGFSVSLWLLAGWAEVLYPLGSCLTTSGRVDAWGRRMFHLSSNALSVSIWMLPVAGVPEVLAFRFVFGVSTAKRPTRHQRLLAQELLRSPPA